MSVTRFRLGRASRLERQIVEVMRAVSQGMDVQHSFSTAFQTALEKLVRTALEQGQQIWTPGNPHIGPDELRLVGWLALFQRERFEILAPINRELLCSLRDAATILKLSHFLPYQAVLKAGFVSGQPIGQVRPGYDCEFQQGNARGHRGRTARQASIRARAVAFVREHGCVSTKELGAIGVSPQYLSVLRHRGALIRVRHGYYEAPPLECAISIDGAQAARSYRNFHMQSRESFPGSSNASGPQNPASGIAHGPS